MTGLERGGRVAGMGNAGPREANLDDMLHTENGSCCGGWPACPRCGAREHVQGVYGGLVQLCEACPSDADRWKPHGTYKADCSLIEDHTGDCTCGACACSMCGGNAMSCGGQCARSSTKDDA